VKTTGEASKLLADSDRKSIVADGKDLAFISVQITDNDGLTVPRSNHTIEFSIEGPGEILATDNGDPTSMISFKSTTRQAFNGLCLVIVRSKQGEMGDIIVTAKSAGLKEATVKIESSVQ
jgi:beta-galactosidase